MSAPLHVATFPVGGFTCTIEYPSLQANPSGELTVGVLRTRFDPAPGPTWHALTAAERAQYVAGRDAGAQHVAELLRERVGVVSLAALLDPGS